MPFLAFLAVQNHIYEYMTEPLFYSEQLAEPGATLLLTGDEARHAAAARRLHDGDTLWLFDGHGGIARATLLRTTARGGTLELRIEERRTEPPPRPAIHIACALPKGDRQQVLLDMATQLGMTRFTPLDCTRSVVRPGANSPARWRKICLEACKQSRRLYLPTIEASSTLPDVARHAAAEGNQVWLAHPAAQAVSVTAAISQRVNDVTLLVGPEGGFTEAEIKLAVAAGARPLTLGTSILRIETAAVALVAAFALAAGSNPA
jgi:16S rRNA (uracil1498-N3)-methyltransferase